MINAMPSFGCGDRCMHSGAYRAAMRTLPCEDVPLEDPAFVEYLEDARTVALTWPKDWSSGFTLLVSDLQRLGCAALTAPSTDVNYPFFVYGINLCAGGHGTFFPFKPLAFFCPASCGCRRGQPFCPETCPTREADGELCMDYMLTANADPFNVGVCPIHPFSL